MWPLEIVFHRFCMNAFGWYPEFTIRWSCPINSSREYLEISQNRSFANVIRPCRSVSATIAD
jgi:hypothetical protein